MDLGPTGRTETTYLSEKKEENTSTCWFLKTARKLRSFMFFTKGL